jgi:transcriptional repressor NF-X1
MMNGRAFGGQLSSSVQTPNNISEGSLAGDAAVFVPGQPVSSRARQHHQAPRARRMSKSQAPDIATRTHEDITNGQYECVICTNEVLPNSKIWGCKDCWSVLHLSCVKKWSKNEVSTLQQRAADNGELPPPRQWRCPGCNLPKQELPDNYTCWCAKEIEPRSLPGLPPHSCGQTCSKPRVGHCPHPCELVCHAGPCPPCRHNGPTLPCFCGKETSTRRCLDTNYDSGWGCGQVCDDILPCGEHNCQRTCHEGLCGSCEVPIESRCFCGKVEKLVLCSERDDERESYSKDETWMGSFDCGEECRRPYDCGNPDHFCESTCHVQDTKPAHCPYSPDVVTHCPCGKTSLENLLESPREACSAPIPHCKEKCQKLLACGHLCQDLCHEGECNPCFQTAEINCRCGRTSSHTFCHQGLDEPPMCMRVDRTTLNCGRHECGEHCCPGEKKASERQAAKRKNRFAGADNFEAEHICLRACGRPLKCGNHFCAELCHKGPCGTCLEAVFDEISCACGKTVLQPPQPCGIRPPECRFDCTRHRNCGHPQVKHQCHEDNEDCPKCPFLMEKPCVCGKKTLKNQPCWFNEVRCGLPCGKKLKCGNHFCQKTCHRGGQCEDASSPCIQPCGRKKTVCEHACMDQCHAPYPCKESSPCQAKTFITCECQHQKQPVKCLASKTSDGNSKKTLDCNEECLKIQRNAKLAAALNIDPATHLSDHIPYSQQTLDMFKTMPKFCQQYEREFRVFAADEKEKRMRFKPMQPAQRAFLHSMAEDFGLDSESQDPEPHRHVSIFKTPKFVSAPMKTLSQCIKLRPAPVAVEPVTANKSLVANAEPYNAFLLVNPRFGLTIDELHADIRADFTTAGFPEFEISFLPSGDIVTKPLLATFMPSQRIEANLITMKSAISAKVLSLALAASSTLCAVDSSLNVLRREDESTASAGGWSQVAKGATRVRAPVMRDVGIKSSFTVLGSKSAKKVKKEEQESAVDDWEREVEGWGDV